jgi:glutamine amidotransferase/cyclase
MPSPSNKEWVLATSSYGEDFIAAVSKGAAMATQFHPEKSGAVGLRILRSFLEPEAVAAEAEAAAEASARASSNGHASTSGTADSNGHLRGLAKRVIACLDVRANDAGDLVVTKGDQYDVREKGGDKDVRNLGQPVDLASRWVGFADMWQLHGTACCVWMDERIVVRATQRDAQYLVGGLPWLPK